MRVFIQTKTGLYPAKTRRFDGKNYALLHAIWRIVKVIYGAWVLLCTIYTYSGPCSSLVLFWSDATMKYAVFVVCTPVHACFPSHSKA